jgi:D-aspartate ligase
MAAAHGEDQVGAAPVGTESNGLRVAKSLAHARVLLTAVDTRTLRIGQWSRNVRSHYVKSLIGRVFADELAGPFLPRNPKRDTLGRIAVFGSGRIR